jgi:hypothetical protein
MIHFDWSISLGQVVTLVTLLGLGAHLHGQLVTLGQQHGMMWDDYAARHGLTGSSPKACAAHHDNHERSRSGHE